MNQRVIDSKTLIPVGLVGVVLVSVLGFLYKASDYKSLVTEAMHKHQQEQATELSEFRENQAKELRAITNTLTRIDVTVTNNTKVLDEVRNSLKTYDGAITSLQRRVDRIEAWKDQLASTKEDGK